MLNGIMSWMGFGMNSSQELRNTGRDRLRLYGRYKRLYDGWAVRNNSSTVFQWKRIKYNVAGPVIDIQSDFFAGKEIMWLVADKKEDGIGNNEQLQAIMKQVTTTPEGNKEATPQLMESVPTNEATQIAGDIWLRSGGTHAFMENALSASIYGDSCIVLGKKVGGQDDGKHFLRWVDASICYPVMDPHDYDRIIKLTIAYRFWDPDGGNHFYEEVWEKGEVIVRIDEKVVPEQSGPYDEEKYGGIPARWIPNLKVKGEQFGRSDVAPIVDLVEEYDHLCQKMTQIIDYYASPNIYFKGTRKPDKLEKNNRTIYFLPENGETGFIEWKAKMPMVDTHIDRVREAISELSSTPLIAFGKVDLSSSDVSGLALKMLFGPLLAKTDRKRSAWMPKLAYMMWVALDAEGVEVDITDIDILWQSPLPNNTKEDWEIGVLKDSLGVSRKQIQREQGYTEEQIAQMQLDAVNETQITNALEVKKQTTISAATPIPPTKPAPNPSGK